MGILYVESLSSLTTAPLVFTHIAAVVDKPG